MKVLYFSENEFDQTTLKTMNAGFFLRTDYLRSICNHFHSLSLPETLDKIFTIYFVLKDRGTFVCPGVTFQGLLLVPDVSRPFY